MTLKDFKIITQNFFSAYLPNGLYLFFGDISDIVGLKDIQYPAVFVDVSNAEIDRVGTTYTLTYYIVDLIDKHDKSNFIDVVSECEKIGYNYIAYLRALDDVVFGYDADNIRLSIIKDTYNDDEISGISFSLNIRTENNINSCEIPLTSAPAVVLQENGAPILLE